MRSRLAFRLSIVLAVFGLLAAACSSDDPSTASGTSPVAADCTPAESPIVTVTAYSNVYDVYGKLISTFQSDWKESHTDQQVQFSTSFGGSVFRTCASLSATSESSATWAVNVFEAATPTSIPQRV